MEMDIEKLMSSKSFKELTSQEREEWKDLFTTEEEYDQMKSMFAGLAQIREEEFEPSVKMKKSLDDIFEQTHGAALVESTPTVWMRLFPKEKSLFQRPLVQIAAAVLLIVLAVPFLTNNSITKDGMQVAQEDVKTTTPGETTIGPKDQVVGSGTVTAKNDLLPAPSSITDERAMDEEVTMAESFSAIEDPGMVAPAPTTASHSDLDWDKEATTSYGNSQASTAAVKSTSVSEQKAVLDLLTVSF